MLRVYFDAGALVKRYTVEDGTTLVNELFRRLPLTHMICATVRVLEVVSVLVRKRNDARLSTKLFNEAMLTFRNELMEEGGFSVTAVDDQLVLP